MLLAVLKPLAVSKRPNESDAPFKTILLVFISPVEDQSLTVAAEVTNCLFRKSFQVKGSN